MVMFFSVNPQVKCVRDQISVSFTTDTLHCFPAFRWSLGPGDRVLHLDPTLFCELLGLCPGLFFVYLLLVCSKVGSFLVFFVVVSVLRSTLPIPFLFGLAIAR